MENSDHIARQPIPTTVVEETENTPQKAINLLQERRERQAKIENMAETLRAMEGEQAPAANVREPEPLPNKADTQLGRPTRGRRQSASQCIYFADDRQIDHLKSIAARFPQCSISRIIQQLVTDFLKAADKTPPEERVIETQVRVFL